MVAPRSYKVAQPFSDLDPSLALHHGGFDVRCRSGSKLRGLQARSMVVGRPDLYIESSGMR